MNANTRLRLWKETRALLPAWGATIGLMVVPYLMGANYPVRFLTIAYWLGCALLGAIVFGHEFQHRTLGLLLTQPVSRRRLWWEKMAVLAIAQFGLLLLSLGLWFFEAENRYLFEHAHGVTNFLRIAPIFYAPIIGFSTGPVLTLLARSTIGGLALTYLTPWVLCMLSFVPLAAIVDGRKGVPIYLLTYLAIIGGGIYSLVMLRLGCLRFDRLEDANTHAREISLPTALLKPFAWFTERLTFGRRSALGSLVRKEVRLQMPACVVALGLVALWIMLVAVVFARPTVAKYFLLLPVILLALGIPVIAGIVSTAEERDLGVHEWHLTLPVSARRLWTVKVLVALGVNAVLGLLLPGLLAHVSSWLANNPQLVAEIPGNANALLIANLVIVVAGLYASSASTNSMRALIGTVVLFLAGAMVMNFADFVAAFHPKQAYAATPVRDYLAVGDILGWLQSHRWPLGWGYFSVWLYLLGLASYQRSLESLWLPVRRMALFFAALCLFIFEAIVW